MKIAGIIFYATIFSLSIATSTWATGVAEVAPANFKITHSAVNELLSQKTVMELFQDSAGMLWIRTQDGLHRYDGYDLRSFYPHDNGLGVMSDRNTPQIAEDQSGTIWLATQDKGISYYDPNNQVFRPATLHRNQPGELLPPEGSAVYTDTSGFIWLGYGNGDVSRLNPLTKTVDLKLSLGKLLRQPSMVIGFAEDRQRNLWIATINGRLFTCVAFSANCTEFFYKPAGQTIGTADTATVIIGDHRGRIWLGTIASGVYVIDTASAEVSHFSHDPDDNGSLSNDTVKSIYEDRAQRIWIGTDKGLNVLGTRGGFTRFNSANSGLPNTRILSITQDERKNLWIGSFFGLYQGRDSQFDSFAEKQGLTSLAITSFAEDHTGVPWVATYDGLYKFTGGEEPFKPVSSVIPGFQLADPRVMSLMYSDPFLWIAYRAHGLDKVNVHTGRVTRFHSSENPTLQSNEFSDIARIGPHAVAATSFGGGLYVFSDTTNEITDFRRSEANPDSLSSNFLLCIYPTAEADVLLGSNQGLSAYSPRRNEVYRVHAHDQESRFIESTWIQVIQEDAAGNIWLGTDAAGLILWKNEDREAGRNIFSRVTTIPPLPGQTVYAIEVDTAGALWISTTNGLVRMDPATLRAQIFDQSDGLQDNEFDAAVSFRDSLNRLYFGGSQGFNRFSPEQIVDHKVPSPVKLTEIEIAGIPVPYDPVYDPLSELKLTHRDYFVNFKFSALDFTDPSRNRYRYKLENFDTSWVDIGTRHNATFTNLPAGEYTLKVEASNSDGVWTREGITLPISVLPAPWLSWWAFCIYCGLVLAALLWVKKFFETRTLQQQATQFASQMQHTAERALDDLQDQMQMEQQLVQNIHLHTLRTLNIVAGLLERQAESIDDDTILDTFRDNQQRCRCLELLEESLYYSGEHLEINFHQFLERLFAEFFPTSFRPGQEIVFINDTLDTLIPAEIGVPVALLANELLLNSLKHAFEDAAGVHSVRVYLRETESLDGWLLEIQDTGCGLPGSIRPEQPTTTGLDIVQRFSRQLGASMVVYRDGGTRYAFEIPKFRDNQAGS